MDRAEWQYIQQTARNQMENTPHHLDLQKDRELLIIQLLAELLDQVERLRIKIP